MIRNYLLRHAQVFLNSLGQLFRTPISSLMTLLVIAITLVLPTGLYIILDNLKGLGGSLGDSVRITLFLEKNTSQSATDTLLSKLKRHPDVDKVRYLSPSESLEDFKALSGFGQIVDQLDENPLPAVIQVVPSSGQRQLEQLESLATELRKLPHIELAQLDSKWVERLRTLLELGTRGVIILASLLAMGVLLIIGNTIRLAVLNRRREIEIIKLVGGTDAFVRRPFLYAGTLQGALGALISVGLIYSILAALSGPISELNQAYGGQFELQGLGLDGSALLILSGGILGWAGARLAVWRHLRDIEPE